MRQKFRKSLSFLLSLALLFTVMPTAYADVSELGAKSFRFDLLDEDEDDVWGGTSAEEEEADKSELEKLGSGSVSTPADDNDSIDEEAQKGLSAGGLENPEALMPILRSYNPFRKGGPGTKGGDSSGKPGELSLNKTATPSGEEGIWDMELTISAKDLAKSTDVVLVVDRSSSMNEDFENGGVTSDPKRKKLYKAKEAAKSFVENLIQVSNQGSLRIALVSYSDNAKINQTLTNNKESLIQSIDSLSARGATHTQAGIKWARDLLKGSVAERQIIVLLSDGEPTYAYNILEKYWYEEESKVTPGLKVKRYPDKIMSPLTTDASRIYFLNGESFELTEHPFKYRETIKTVQELYMDYENSTPHFDTEKRKSPRFADNPYFGYESDAKRDDVDMINVYNQTISEANIAKRDGYKIYTVGLSLSAQAQSLMNEVGIDGSYSSTPEDLKKIYEKIASRISFAATDAIVTDPIGEKFDLVVPPGMKPEDTIKVFDRNGNELSGAVVSWNAATKTFTVKLGTITEALSPIKIQYKVRINPDNNIALPGKTYPTNGRTYITYTDSNGNPKQEKDFPIPEVGKDASSIVIYELLVDKDGNILKATDGVFGDKALDKNDYPLSRRLLEYNGDTSLPLHEEIKVDAKASVEKMINGEKKVFQLANIKVAKGTQANSDLDITDSPFVKTFNKAESVEIYFAYLMNEKVDLILPKAKDLTKVYDATPLTGVAKSNTPGAKIEYSVDGGKTWTEVPPSRTEVGRTPVQVKASKIGYETSYGSYTLLVTRKLVTVTADDKSKKKGESDPELTVKVDGVIDGFKIDYKITRKPGEEVGTYPINVSGKEEQGNYKVIFAPGKLTITQNTADALKLTAKGGTKIYDAKPLMPIVSVIKGAKIEYSTDDGASWSGTVPSITNVGSLKVKVRASKAGYDTAVVECLLQVTARQVTVTADDKSKKKGESDPELTVTIDGVIDGFVIKYDISRMPGEEVGAYPISPFGEKIQGNYEVTFKAGTFTIKNGSSADLKLVAKDAEKVYDGTPLAPAATAIDGAKIQYSTDDGKTWKDEVPSITNVGTQAVKVRASKDGYDPAEASYTLKVTPKAVTVTANDKTKKSGMADPAFDATVVGVVGADKVIYNITRDPGEAPGKYAIKPAGAAVQGNYAVTYVNGTLTIENHTSADLKLVAKDAEKVYDGTPLAPAATAIDGAKIQYSTDDGRTWKDEVPSITNVGTQAVKVRASKDGYDPAEASYTLKVTPKAVTVTANDKSKELGEKDPDLDAKVEGLLGADAVVYTVERVPGEAIGTYVITPKGADTQGNYTVKYVTGIFTIVKKPAAALKLVAKDAEKVYDGTPLAPAATAIDGAKIQYSTDDGKTWKDEVPSITNVGTQAVKVRASKDGYDPAEASYTLKVTPKPVTVKAEDKSKTKGNADPALTAKVQGLLGTDKVVYTLKRTAGEGSGTYRIEVSGEVKQGNYTVTYVPGIFTIRDKGGNSIITTPDNNDSGSSSSPGTGSPSKTDTIKDAKPPLGKLNTEDHFAYIQGYPDGTVQPQGLLTREEVAAVFFRLLDKSYREEIRTQSNNFGDVRGEIWSNKHISTLTKGKIINGYEDGSFRPHNSITRAELAAIASRFDRLEVNATHKFTDLNGHWAEKYIASAVKKGWVNGYEDGTFQPDRYITRAEFVNFVNNVLNRHVKEQDILKDSRVFTDLVDASKWYYTAMKAATNSYLYSDGGTQNKDGVLIKFQKWTKLITPVIEM